MFQTYFFLATLMITYMLAVVMSLTMEAPMMTLEKIIFGSTDKKKEIAEKPNTESLNKVVEENAYDNIAMDHRLDTGYEKIVTQNVSNQSPDGSVSATLTTKSIGSPAFAPGLIQADYVHLAFEKEQSTPL